MRKNILYVSVLLFLCTSTVLSGDWSEKSKIYYGRGQQLSVWKNGTQEKVFLADSASFLYSKSISSNLWDKFQDSLTINPRGVVGIIDHDTLLISRFGYGLSEDSSGVFRCEDPSDLTSLFINTSDAPGTSLRNRHVRGFVPNPRVSTFIYALSKSFFGSSGVESGTQWSNDYGDRWQYVNCDSDDIGTPNTNQPDTLFFENECVALYDTVSSWFIGLEGSPENSGVFLVELSSNWGDCRGAYQKKFEAPVKGISSTVRVIGQNVFESFYAGVYSGDSIGVWKSNDLGDTWSYCDSTNYPITTIDIASPDLHSGINDPLIFAGTDGYGILRSNDSGNSWIFVNEGLNCKKIQKLVIPSGGIEDDSTIYALGEWSVYKSSNFGESWDEINQGINQVSVNALASNYPSKYLLADFDIFDRSIDGGENWETLHAFDGKPSSNRIGYTRATHIEAFKNNDSILLVSTYVPETDSTTKGIAQLYKSLDEGESWSLVFSSIITDTAEISSIVPDPTNESIVYLTFNDDINNLILKSNSYADSASWSIIESGLTSVSGVNKIAINKLNNNVLYIGTTGEGVYKSINGGTSWVSSGLSNHNVRDVLVSLNDSSIVWVATDSGVYKTMNSGSSWSLMDSSMTCTNSYSLTSLEGATVEHIFVVAECSGNGYLYESINNGINWNDITSGLPTDWLVHDSEGVYVNLGIDTDNGSSILYIGTNVGIYQYDAGGYSGSISYNYTWSKDNINILGDITIDSGVVLTIDSGVSVEIDTVDELESGYDVNAIEFIVNGELRINGTSSNRVLLKSDNSSNQSWRGIRVMSPTASYSGKLFMDNVEIRGAYEGVRLATGFAGDTLRVDTIMNCLFDSCFMRGIILDKKNCYLSADTFLNTGNGYGIYIGGHGMIDSTTIIRSNYFQNVKYPIYSYYASPIIEYSDFYITDTTTTVGYGQPAIWLDRESNAKIRVCDINNYKTGIKIDLLSDVKITDVSFDSDSLYFSSDTVSFMNIAINGTGLLSDCKVRTSCFKNVNERHVFQSNTTFDLGTASSSGNNTFFVETYCKSSICPFSYNPEKAVENTSIDTLFAVGNYWELDTVWWTAGIIDDSSPNLFPNFDCNDQVFEFKTNTLEENDELIPEKFSVSQNYPNPFNPETQILFTLPEVSLVKIEIFNVIGQRVKLLLNKSLEAGEHTIHWNSVDESGNKVSSGIYLYRIEAGENIETKKMILLK